MIISSGFRVSDTLMQDFPQEVIKKEPMLFQSDFKFAWANGGEITKEFLRKLPYEWVENGHNLVIDSRVHMLMPGMYPCIPGWHHDDVPREREDGQPNYENPSYKAEHILAIWGDCSLTEFASGWIDIEIPPIGKVIYRELAPVLAEKIENGELTVSTIEPRRMVFFDWNSWHRGAETTHHGFRFFIRATSNTATKPKNEIRYNANVYMKNLEEGW